MNNEFFFDTEDNFLYPNPRPQSGRKTLNQIFDVDPKPGKGEESLRYVPPKSDAIKPEKTDKADVQRVSWSTRMAKIVIGFKNGETVGRVGVALLKNIEDACRIIVYKTKTNLLATYTILDDGDEPHIHRQNCYWQFYDDNGVYWSLLFERAADEADFINKLKDFRIRLQLDLEVHPDNIGHLEELKKMEPPHEKSEKTMLLEDKTSKFHKDELTSVLLNEQKKSKTLNTERAKLMSRLPKMGGQQLPQFDEPNNSDINESNNDSIDHCTSLTIIGQATTYPKKSDVHTQFLLPMAHTASSSSASMSPVEAQVMQMMLVENRTQNTELRINMDKLECKLEKVIDKIDMLQVSNEHEDELFRLEEKILALKKENRRLRRESRNINGKIDSSHENLFNIYGTELTNLGIDMEPGVTHEMDSIVGELIDKITSLQTQLHEKETQLKNVASALKDQKERNQHDKRQHIKLSEELQQAHNKIDVLQATLDKKKENEAQLHARLSDLRSQHVTHLSNVKTQMTETVKDIMNTLYHNLAQSIVSMEKLVPDKILALIGKTIRQDTLSAVAKITNK